MQKTLPIWIVLLTALAPAAWAQRFIETHPGYADLSHFEEVLGGEMSFDIDLDHQQIAAMLQWNQASSAELAALVDSIEGVRARVFDVEAGQAATVRERLAETAGQLKSDGWNSFISVQEKGDQVELFLRLDAERILGVAALFAGEDEAGFANLVGDIEMAQVFSQMSNLSALRGVLEGMRDRGETGG